MVAANIATKRYVKPRFCNRISITSRNSCKHGHFLDFSFHRMDDTLSMKNLAGMPVFIGLSTFTTISIAKSGFNLFTRTAPNIKQMYDAAN
jgi:hypothetical protein